MTHSVLKVELPLPGEGWNIPGDQKKNRRKQKEFWLGVQQARKMFLTSQCEGLSPCRAERRHSSPQDK